MMREWCLTERIVGEVDAAAAVSRGVVVKKYEKKNEDDQKQWFMGLLLSKPFYIIQLVKPDFRTNKD